ncbi:unnamed protein product [Leptidea sinapis]|uniref:Peptidase S8/S53 domain-containing protein n=1 Tax=Leptidea sinapis TaxID=189913 RepID=A0A5E4Q0B4_9NEOP|nr:unnamed protein product [Leptidea sinapis]
MWLLCITATVIVASASSREVFTNSFLVRFKRSLRHEEAHQIALGHGFDNLGPVLSSDTEWHFTHRGLPHARPRRSVVHTRLLKRNPLVHTAVQQTGFKRVKRGFRPLRLPETVPASEPRDPYFPLQWYLKNTGQNGGKPKLDLNVEAAWAQGYTGVNVTTAIMDDGVDYMHPDLKYNYNAEASYDFSSNDPFPYPRYTDDWFNSHGTRCAGEVAAARDNGVCGVGPYMTDLIEANSMGHEPHKIHIYSASWGPTDDGRTGRNGLGNIYVWASGDGGEDDDCNSR